MSEHAPAYAGWTADEVRHFQALYDVYMHRTRCMHGHTDVDMENTFSVSIPRFVSKNVLDRFDKVLQVSGYTVEIVGHTWFVKPQKPVAEDSHPMLAELDRLTTLCQNKMCDNEDEEEWE